MYELKKIQLIDLGIFVGKIDEVNPEQISSDIKNYSKNIAQECDSSQAISRGFVQYEDLLVPLTPEVLKLENVVKNLLFNLTQRQYDLRETWAVDLEFNQSVISHSHYSNLHIHPEEYFSVTYYPQVPEGSADLIFSADYCNLMSSTVSVTPEVGTVIIFNSYIQHMTSRNKSKESRLVVSQNWCPTEPNMTENADWSVYLDRPTVSQPFAV